MTLFYLVLSLLPCITAAFISIGISSYPKRYSSLVYSSRRFPSTLSIKLSANPNSNEGENDTLQYNLFKQHHAIGRWHGTWNTFDYIGNVVDSTRACVHLQYDANTDQVIHSHKIVVASTSSDCNTCFDSTQIKTLPIATYSNSQDLLKRRMRCAYNTMVVGPTLLRSIPGAISTELILPTILSPSHHSQPIRVRVIFQHAPVWEQGVEPTSCPPQGLKLFRMILCREQAMIEASSSENWTQAKSQHPYFLQNIPPYQWHKKWAGTSWTWGPTLGDRGWNIEELEDLDAWHGRPMGDSDNVWAMRLPGGIYVSCPRVITGDEAGICRMAWLLMEDEDSTNSNTAAETTPATMGNARLARVEASIFALQPLMDPETNNLVGFQPPSLGSLRCDVLTNIGELENASRLDELLAL